MANGKVRSGIEAAEHKRSWEISTVEMKDYLQKKLNVSTAAARKRVADEGKDETFIKDINILSLNSISPTKKFHSILLILDMSAIEGGRSNSNELSIFNPNNEGGSPRLKNYVWFVLKDYFYTKDDRAAMNNPKYQKQVGGLKTRDANAIASLMTPKYATSGKGGPRLVKVLLDPIKIFWDMLTDLDTGKQPDVYIKDIKKMNKYNFIYTVREPFRDEIDEDFVGRTPTADLIADAVQDQFLNRPSSF